MTARGSIVRLALSEEQTDAIAASLAPSLRPGDVVALHGELGAGKTRFVRGMARGLGVDPARVHSPTFVIVNVYENPAGPALVHLDAYRLRTADELDALAWDRLSDGSNIIVVEWAERIEPRLQGERFDVTLEHAGETSRRIRIEWPEGRDVPLASTLGAAPSVQNSAASSGARAVKCRTCGGDVREYTPAAPFCSERCRLADLNRWFSGEHKISRPIEEGDLADE